MCGESNGENPIEIFQIHVLTKLSKFKVFAHLHLINHNFKNVLKTLI